MALGTTIAATARAAVGAPFAWGGTNPTSGLDGAGLVRHAYGSNGVDLPAHPMNMVTLGNEVPVGKLQPGDVLFFSADSKGKQSDQVGVYLGRGRFVHAPGPGQAAKVSSLTEAYYMDRLQNARRMPGVQTSYPQTWQQVS